MSILHGLILCFAKHIANTIAKRVANSYTKYNANQTLLCGKMRLVSPDVVNEQYEPTENDDKVLEALKQGRESGDPWGRANPRWLIDQTGLEKGNVEFSLRQLTSAGWVRRVARGCYEFVADPREERRDVSAVVETEQESGASVASERGGQEDCVEAIVSEVSHSWDDDDRLEDRRAAARAALQALQDRGQLGRTEAVDELGLRDQCPVNGQDEETWWRQNIRPVLSEVASYSRGRHAYVLDEGALGDS
jgi:hypothetical protein